MLKALVIGDVMDTAIAMGAFGTACFLCKDLSMAFCFVLPLLVFAVVLMHLDVVHSGIAIAMAVAAARKAVIEIVLSIGAPGATALPHTYPGIIDSLVIATWFALS